MCAQETNDDQIAKLQAAILRYLANHPSAADTARGIVRYWIVEWASNEPPPSVEIARRALDALVAQKRLACTTLADGSKVYESVEADQPDGAIKSDLSRPKR